MKKFKDFPELEKYLQNITENQFKKYQSAGQKFIYSENFKKWQAKNALEDIGDKIINFS